MSNLPTIGATTAAIAATLTQNQVTKTEGGGAQFLSFDSKRTGEWLFGIEKEPCTGDVFALDLTTLQHGYVQWHMKKANRKLVPINAALPTPQPTIEYQDSKGRTQYDEASEARSLEGTFDDGTRFVFETNSFGGRKAVDTVLGELFSRAATGNPYLFPHIELDSDSYEHKTYGKLWNPVLKIVAWYAEDGTLEGDAPAAVEHKPEKKAAPAEPVEEEAPAEEAPAPTRRRRRAAS